MHALFLEALKSREISKEQSICLTRLAWWEESLKDVILERGANQPREPIMVIMKDAKDKTCINTRLL